MKTIELSDADIAVVIRALSDVPFRIAAPIIMSIDRQLKLAATAQPPPTE